MRLAWTDNEEIGMDRIRVDITPDSVERLVYDQLTEYLVDLEECVNQIEASGLTMTTRVYSSNPKRELKELKKDIKAIKRVRLFYA